MNTTMVPTTATHNFSRPPYTTDPITSCLSQLSDLERWFGTQHLAEALDQLNRDHAYQARLRAFRPDTSVQEAVDAIRVLRSSGYPESAALADQIEAGVNAATPLPVATPFPGLAVAS